MSIHLGELTVNNGGKKIHRANGEIDFYRDEIVITLYWREGDAEAPTEIRMPVSMAFLARASTEFVDRSMTALSAFRGGKK